MTDCRDTVTVWFDDERLRFEPRSDGRWRLVDEEWDTCRWRTRGTQLVDEIAVTDSRE